MCAKGYSQVRKDTFRIYFALNVPELSKNMQRKIDLLIYNDKIYSGTGITIVGYADYLGTEAHNKGLSLNRAKNIKAYLVKNGIDPDNIVTCVGKGEIKHEEDSTSAEGVPDDRRVDIVVNYSNKRRISSHTGSSQARNKGGSGTNNKSSSNTTKEGNTGENTADTTTLTGTGMFKDIDKMQAGQVIVMRNVYFPLGSHIIKPESYEALEQLFKTLKDNPTLKISIEGHVCCIQNDVPDAVDNQTNQPELSFNRAKAIFNYLVRKGIDESRLQYKGFGKRFPIVMDDRNEEDAELNRRVEVRILSK